MSGSDTTKKREKSTKLIKSSKTVLVAEDDPLSALLLEKILKDMGLYPVHVSNGLDAVNYVKDNNPCNLILMDLDMPVMNGFEAINKIKEINTDIPIIIQTAYDSETGRRKATELKVHDFLSKPINRQQLAEKVKRYVKEPGIIL